MYSRIFLIVLDSLGVGELPDAIQFSDMGADTFGHIIEAVPDIRIPNLEKLGMYKLHPDKYHSEKEQLLGRCLKLAEKSKSKDTMAGHWEMMGLETVRPFRTFTETGFPAELVRRLEERTGKKVIGNRAASGTEIIHELAYREASENAMIVYTSADSVLQICGNEETFDLQKLYQCCEIARELTMQDQWKVGRVIARPYVQKADGSYERTANRKDYALEPFAKTYLDALKQEGLDVVAVGKISDIFARKGITEGYHSESSAHGMEQTIELLDKDFRGLCFTNLVDFDAKWGHRRNVKGYAEELERFDSKLGIFMQKLKKEDLLIITADHGTDPTFKGTDHTREYVPCIAYSPSMIGGRMLDTESTFAVIGASIADNFHVEQPAACIGHSILEKFM